MSEQSPSSDPTMTTTPITIDPNDPSNYIYVATMNYNRKLEVENGQISGVASALNHIGPLGGLLISIFDIIVGLVASAIVNMFRISTYAFDWLMGLAFGGYSGMIPIDGKKGTLITYKFMRYIIMTLYPPLGIFLNKGIYAWFNIFLAFLLCYVHYILGIIYAFVICSTNRYADLYERTLINGYYAANQPTPVPGDPTDYTAFYYSVTVFLIVVIFIFLFIKFA